MSVQMGKKSGGSSNSSMVNTPASTPVTTMANGQQSTPPPNNAPKYGTLVPNRIFVGGISANTTETELLQLFSNYGTVKAAKIIQDRAGVSKGYGFITFESEDDAKRLQREADNIVLRERKLNIAPAIKKQPFSRAFDGSSPPAVASGYPPNFFPPGSMPFFQGGVAYYPQPPTGPTDPATQQPAVYQTPSVYPPQSAPPQAAPYQPVMFPPQPIYMPQQYPMPMPYDYNYYPNGGASYMLGGPGGGGGQNGGSGPQSTSGGGCQPPPMQQRTNSPPRPQVYSHQLQPAVSGAAGGYANHQDIYYNMYPLEGTMYADPGQGIEAMSLSNGVMSEEYHHHHPQPDELLPPGGARNNAQTPKGQTSDTSRQTTTPVVSLLSLDHQQEKDLLSMQSGRRRKPPPPTPPQSSVASTTTATIPLLIPNFLPPPPPELAALPHQSNGFNTFQPTTPYDFQFASLGYQRPPVVPNGMTIPCIGHPKLNHHLISWNTNNTHHNHNHTNNNNNKRVSWKARSVDTSSLSSPRTDSNSSASCVADDTSRHHHDDKRRHSQPPPFSVHVNTNSNSPQPRFQNNAQNHHQTVFPRRVFFSGKNAQFRNNRPAYNNEYHYQQSQHYKYNGTQQMKQTSFVSTTSASPPSTNIAVATTTSSSSTQLNPTSASSQMQSVNVNPGLPQHFVAPARQRRRGIGRRGLGEIGAGDAPLSNAANQENLNDACNKMDGLKL